MPTLIRKDASGEKSGFLTVSSKRRTWKRRGGRGIEPDYQQGTNRPQLREEGGGERTVRLLLSWKAASSELTNGTAKTNWGGDGDITGRKQINLHQGYLKENTKRSTKKIISERNGCYNIASMKEKFQGPSDTLTHRYRGRGTAGIKKKGVLALQTKRITAQARSNNNGCGIRP